MPHRPPDASRLLRSWHAVVADGIAVLWFLSSNSAMTLKIVVAGVVLFGAQAILIFQLGRRHEWQRLEPTIRELARRAEEADPRAGRRRYGTARKAA